MRQPPCKDCPSKGCGKKHDACPAYLEWKAEHLEETRRIGEESRYTSQVIEAVIRCSKGRRKK